MMKLAVPLVKAPAAARVAEERESTVAAKDVASSPAVVNEYNATDIAGAESA
jgi:hypothetical protein